MGMDQYLLIAFLVGWTSIYQLFWCSPGAQGFDTLPDGQVFKHVHMGVVENKVPPAIWWLMTFFWNGQFLGLAVYWYTMAYPIVRQIQMMESFWKFLKRVWQMYVGETAILVRWNVGLHARVLKAACFSDFLHHLNHHAWSNNPSFFLPSMGHVSHCFTQDFEISNDFCWPCLA